METYQIIIIVICAVLLFLYYRRDCSEYFSATGLNATDKKNIQNLIGIWRPILLPSANEAELEKLITDYSIGKHNIQLKRLAIKNDISDAIKAEYWIDDKTSNYIDTTGIDEQKLSNFERSIETTQQNDLISNLKPLISIDPKNIAGINAQMNEVKKNLQQHGCLIKQEILTTLVQDGKITTDKAKNIWFDCN
jgi:hypothetical protein